MFFLFLFSYLCLSYLHDRLFCLPPPPDSFIKFRSLLLRSLCLSVCATSATKSKNNPKKKKNHHRKIPSCSSFRQSPWQHWDPFYSTSFWLGIHITDPRTVRTVYFSWMSGERPSQKNVNAFLTTFEQVLDILHCPIGKDLGWEMKSLLKALPQGKYT